MTTQPLVVVVEDEPELRRLMEEALEEQGYRVYAARDGKTALSALEYLRPDVVLLDIHLPDMSGWEIRKQMSQDERLAGVPVLAVTAYGGSTIEASARESLGFVGLLRKPFQLDALLEETRRTIEARASS